MSIFNNFFKKTTEPHYDHPTAAFKKLPTEVQKQIENDEYVDVLESMGCRWHDNGLENESGDVIMHMHGRCFEFNQTPHHFRGFFVYESFNGKDVLSYEEFMEYIDYNPHKLKKFYLLK